MMDRGAWMGGVQVYPPPPQAHAHGQAAVNQQQPPNNWAGNDANTLLVVATSPAGTGRTRKLPGDGKTVPHRAGDPVMRDLHWPRCWVFMAASWIGFAGSMLMTLSLLVRMPVDSRHVRWSFAVAYASLVLTFVVS